MRLEGRRRGLRVAVAATEGVRRLEGGGVEAGVEVPVEELVEGLGHVLLLAGEDVAPRGEAHQALHRVRDGEWVSEGWRG